MEHNLAAIFANASGGDHRLTRLASAQPLGNSIDVEIDDPVLGQIAPDKSVVLRPQPFSDLAHRRAREQPTPAVRKRIFDVSGRTSVRPRVPAYYATGEPAAKGRRLPRYRSIPANEPECSMITVAASGKIDNRA